MNENKLIAQTLLEIAKRSTTTFLEEGEIDKELIAAAEKVGIVVPSPDLLIMKTVYAEIDKVNLNGVILPRKAVEEGLQTLVGKQCNWEHDGSGRICGFTISAKINEDKIETINVIFKSLFPEETEELREKIKTKEAAVSFEIWQKDPITFKSLVTMRVDGLLEISPILFHGTGVLLVHPPACPKAKIFKMIGRCENIDLKKIEEKSFTGDLVYAQLAIEEPKCKNCGTCTCEKDKEGIKLDELIVENDYEGGEIVEAEKLTTEKRNALPDSDFALIQEKDGKKIRRFPINDEAHVRNALARLPQAKDITEEERKSTLEKILKRAKELNMTELLKKYEKAEESTAENKGRVCLDCGNPLPEDYPKDETICGDCKLKKEKTQAAEVKSEETKAEAEVKPEEVAKTTPEETKTEAEVKPETKPAVAEAPVEVKADEVKEKPIKTISYYVSENIESVGEDGGIDYQSKSYEKIVRIFKDGHEETEVREGSAANDSKITKFTSAQLEEKVNAAKAEKDIEIEKLKGELEVAKQPKEIVKAKEQDNTPDLTVGETETTGEVTGVKKEAKTINDIIAAKHDRK